MRLFYVTSFGEKTSIWAHPMNTISQVKSAIQAKKAIPHDAQRLIFGGTLLADDRTLNDYGILDNATVHMVLKLRGC